MCRLLLLVALVALAALARSAEAQCACPKPSTQANFQPEMYLGLWYEMKRVTRGYEKNGQCGTATYKWADATKTKVDVVNSNYIPDQDAKYTVNLLAAPADINNGKLTVTWPSRPQVAVANYWVLGTDYSSYSVVYSCSEPSAGDLPAVTLWVLARDPSKFDSNTLQTVNGILSRSGFANNDLVDIRHDCPAATCKSCPTSKADLDVAKMAGRWWEVQHSPFSTGSSVQSCSLADVSGTEDGVSIDFINFRGDQAKDEKKTLVAKKKMNGEFTITGGAGGDPSDTFCIVDTDYDNWAVLTVCAKPLPQDQTQMQEGFTKANIGGVYVMSRTKGLRSEHQLAANKAVLSVGYAPSSMETTKASPCPAAAFAESAATHGLPSAFVLSLLMAALFLVKP